MTYLLLNCVFMATLLLVMRKYLPASSRRWWLTLLILLVMTAVFDNVIIGLDIVSYDADKILNLFVYRAPVEDFFYAALAVYMVPALWNYFDNKNVTSERKPS